TRPISTRSLHDALPISAYHYGPSRGHDCKAGRILRGSSGARWGNVAGGPTSAQDRKQNGAKVFAGGYRRQCLLQEGQGRTAESRSEEHTSELQSLAYLV